MRNARIIDNLVITSDNSGAIGQKPQDVVSVPDEVASYFSTRVALLEQLASFSRPIEVILLNFTGQDAWQRYINGIEQLFTEVGYPIPEISGSTETNMPTLQSGFGITMIGKKQQPPLDLAKLHWYSYGRPLVGNDLLANKHQVANLKEIVEALKNNEIKQVIPVGSKGVRHELQQLGLAEIMDFNALPYDADASAGPSTLVLIAVTKEQILKIESKWSALLTRLK
ncbi:MAG: alpha-ribazole-5-phosphate synthase [Kurthia sp.]|nr:alpha-ribazole-5-phosphate synthase [Candidatus Kurthia equi]